MFRLKNLNNCKCRRIGRRQQRSAECDSLHIPLRGLIQMTESGHTEHEMGKQKEFPQEHVDFLEAVTLFGALSIVQIMGYT